MNDTPQNTSSQNPKAVVLDKLRAANNILVTVSADPSIDQLSACIAVTLMLNKYKKSATAVFSGKVPKALDFLKPKETLEPNTDSLRDFIISLDKAKADKLRYKIEDDVVKIFITPYRTSITENDLKYSAGEFNVDVILALGVHHQQDLDRAITAHGRIFHDAVVLSINNVVGGDFGIANWEEFESSSLSEIVAGLSDELDPQLMDTQIATALLTGIVAETSRFSNEKTHPRTMNVSSNLLAAGADQKLVNAQLQDVIGVGAPVAGTEIRPTVSQPEMDTDHTDVAEELVIDEKGSFKQLAADDAPTPKADVAAPAAPANISVAPDLIFEEPDAPAPAVAAGTNNANTATVAPTVPQIHVNDPAAGADDARQAIENALSGQPAQATAPNSPDLDTTFNVAQGAPASQTAGPQIQAIAPNEPSYVNQANVIEYNMPAVPEHEPAPLGMSPADQAFTMPMPPTSSMPPAPATFPPAPRQDDTQIPPPLPPPMMPPTFNGPAK